MDKVTRHFTQLLSSDLYTHPDRCFFTPVSLPADDTLPRSVAMSMSQPPPGPPPGPPGGLQVRALYGHIADQESQLSFSMGDAITLMGVPADGWQFGHNSRTGQYGHLLPLLSLCHLRPLYCHLLGVCLSLSVCQSVSVSVSLFLCLRLSLSPSPSVCLCLCPSLSLPSPPLPHPLSLRFRSFNNIWV